MFISRLLKIGSSTWSRVVPYKKYSTVMNDITNIPPLDRLQPEPKAKRQRGPHPAAKEAWAAMRASKSASNSAISEGVQIVVNTMEAVSIESKPTQNSKANFAFPPKPHQQLISQRPKQNTLQNTSTPKPRVTPGRHRDAKVDPSPASGGIPQPTEDYFRACLSGPSLLKQPQHLLVVIDLNGTLLYRPNKLNPTYFRMRPHAQTFLKYCVDTFTVVIWSSAKPANVNAMCNTILTPDIREKVAAIWGRDTFGLSQEDYNLRTQCYKRLSKIWDDRKIAGRHPGYYEGCRWDQTNTVLIDDSREKARTEPHNLIEAPEYFGDLHERDDILPQVHDYLNHLSMHSNVSACLYKYPWKPTVYTP